MTRLARLVIPGMPHHVTQRGNRRGTTFFEEDDFLANRELLADAAAAAGTKVAALEERSGRVLAAQRRGRKGSENRLLSP